MRREVKSPYLRARVIPYVGTTGSAGSASVNNQDLGDWGGATTSDALPTPKIAFNRACSTVASIGTNVADGGYVSLPWSSDPPTSTVLGGHQSVDESGVADAGTVYGFSVGYDSPSTDKVGTIASRSAAQTVSTTRYGGRVMFFSMDASAATLLVGANDAAVTDNGTGDFTLTFSEAFASSDVAAVVTPVGATSALVESVSATAINIKTFNSSHSPTDVDFNLVVIGYDKTEVAPARKAPLLSTQKDVRLLSFNVTFSGGTPTVASNSGAASIVDNGTGDVTLTFADAFARAPVAVAFGNGRVALGATPSTTAVQVLTTNTAYTAADRNFSLVVFGSDCADEY